MQKTSPLIPITPQSHDVLIEMIYASADNFTGEVIYEHPWCFLHPDAAAGLEKAARGARQLGLKLKVLDAFRPHEAQVALWAIAPLPGYIADPAKGSNHTRGVAIDLTLADEEGRALDMGTPVDTMTAASNHFYAGHAADVQVNRMKLLTVMLEAGFVHYAQEWWHYQLPNAEDYPLIDSHDYLGCVAHRRTLAGSPDRRRRRGAPRASGAFATARSSRSLHRSSFLVREKWKPLASPLLAAKEHARKAAE